MFSRVSSDLLMTTVMWSYQAMIRILQSQLRKQKNSLREQAENFIKTVGELRYKDLPPVLDIETIHSGCSHKTLNDKALTWLKIIEKHYGRKPIVYSSASFIEDILCDEIKRDYPIWVAHYETDTPRYKDWDFWQFTG